MFTAFRVKGFSQHTSHLVEVEVFSDPIEDDVVEEEGSPNDREEEVDFVVGEDDSLDLSIGFDFELVVGLGRVDGNCCVEELAVVTG